MTTENRDRDLKRLQEEETVMEGAYIDEDEIIDAYDEAEEDDAQEEDHEAICIIDIDDEDFDDIDDEDFDDYDYDYYDDLDEQEDETEERRQKNSLLARALASNLFSVWRLHGLIKDRIGEGFPDDTVADTAAEIMLRGTSIILAELTETKVINPILTFEKCRKKGDYDAMDDNAYDILKNHTEKLGDYWKNMPECDLMTVLLRMIDG